jgi:AcrR family transcriptional regulator
VVLHLPGNLKSGARTRARILEVAERQFAEQGYDRTTLRGIAAEVGIRQPSLYKHFLTKHELYGAVLETTFRPLMGFLRTFADATQPDTLSGAGTLAVPMFRLLAEHPTTSRLIYQELLRGPHMHPQMDQRLKKGFGLAKEALQNMGYSDEQVVLVVLSFHAITTQFFAFGQDVAKYLELSFDSERAAELQIKILEGLSHVMLSMRPIYGTADTAAGKGDK